MAKGRKPKPLTEHIANGTYKKSRHDKRFVAPKPLSSIPKMPAYMPSECAEDWVQVCSTLLGNGLLTHEDLHGIEAYCVLRLQYREALEKIALEGQVIIEANGNGIESRKVHPAWRVMLDSQKEIRAIQDRIGYNPYTRQKLTLVKDEENADPFLDAIKRKK
jgi:P27 family predicted phage terminase small subunit